MALGSLSLCQSGCVPLTAHCGLQWHFSSRALLKGISHLSPHTVCGSATWAILGGHWVDSFQLNRKTNSRNSRNTLHWLLGLQSKCLGWNRVGQSPSITHLMVQPRCPAAAPHWGRAPSSAPVTTAIPLCSALLCGDWELGPLRMPIQAIHSSKAGGKAGTSFTVGWSKLHPLWSSPTKEQAVEVAACSAP